MSDATASTATTCTTAHAAPAAAVHRLKLKCRRCSKWRAPEEFLAGGPVIGYCLHCFEKHHEALNVLAGGIPVGCCQCGVSFAVLRDACAPADPRMYLHLVDGLYGLFCPTCSDGYERKRLDLYGSTPYGEAKKLRGAR